MNQYLDVLNRDDWTATISAGIDRDDDAMVWFTTNLAARLHLRAFTNPTEDQ